MRARFIFLQPHRCSPAEPMSQVPSTWPSHSSSRAASHLTAAYCVNVPSVCFALGRDDFHHPAILIHIPVLSPSQILGVGFIYYLAIPGLTFHFYLSVSSSSYSLFISQDISCMYLLLFFFFSFLHELQFSKAFECFRFISAFSDL